MDILNIINNIVSNNYLFESKFKYCLVDENKVPHRWDNDLCHTNKEEDFVNLDTIMNNEEICNYKGLGISIQFNNVCAVDIDHCLKEENNIDTISDLALDIINIFKDEAYVEFSFSGKGIRILFKNKTIDNYKDIYYIKNSKIGVEYYEPSLSYRYVTITGNYIYNNEIKEISEETLYKFLNKYMKRKEDIKHFDTNIDDNRSIDELIKIVRYHYIKNPVFQENWFKKAPGYHHDESDRDYYLVSYIYENITKDREKIKIIFEMSPFFKSKDYAHKNKWNKNDNQYLNKMYDRIRSNYE